MVKFLKIALFLVVIAFAFALGVKFSDSFKGKFGSGEEAEVKVEEEMQDLFDQNGQKINEIGIDQQNIEPTTGSEIVSDEEGVNSEDTGVIGENINSEIIEPMPMDGVENVPSDVNNNNQGVIDSNAVNTNSAITEENISNVVDTANVAPAVNTQNNVPVVNSPTKIR